MDIPDLIISLLVKIPGISGIFEERDFPLGPYCISYMNL